MNMGKPLRGMDPFKLLLWADPGVLWKKGLPSASCFSGDCMMETQGISKAISVRNGLGWGGGGAKRTKVRRLNTVFHGGVSS